MHVLLNKTCIHWYCLRICDKYILLNNTNVYEINVTLILAVGKMEKEAEITQKKLFMEPQSWWSCGQECLPLAFIEG